MRICKARAGVLPLPLKKFLDQIAAKARRADLQLRWAQTDGDPVALITIPTQHEQYQFKEVHLESVQLGDGKLFLAGRTGLDEDEGTISSLPADPTNQSL